MVNLLSSFDEVFFKMQVDRKKSKGDRLWGISMKNLPHGVKLLAVLTE